MKLKFSIRYKILSMVTTLMVIAIALYVMLATRIFRQDKQELVFDLNKSVVTTLAAEIDTTLRGVADKLRLYSFAFTTGATQSEHYEEIFNNDPLLVRIEIYEQNDTGEMVSRHVVNDPAYAKLYALEGSFFTENLQKRRPLPFSAIKSHGLSLWNATVEHGPALIGVGLPFLHRDTKTTGKKIMVAVAYIKADLFLKNLKTSHLSQVFVLGADGRILVHSRAELMVSQANFSHLPIVKELQNSAFPSGVMEYDDDGRNQLGAFAKIPTGNIGVVSQVESSKAFLAVRNLIRRSVLFALIIATISFIATIFFSRSLTGPLRKLMNAMKEVSEGKLDTELKIRSLDEIAVLSHSFNQMTQDLKSSRNQLEEINHDLENKVADRTRKLEEQNHAVKAAQEALIRTTRLASVGEIAGRTAHEVLNPLTSLMARVQKVQKRLTDEIVSNKNLLGEILQAWTKDLDEKGFTGFLKALEEPSRIKPGVSLLQEDLTNINEIFSTWDRDLGTLTSDTQFLMQQAIRIEKILRQMRSLSTVSGQKAKMKVNPLIHDAINIVADLFSKNGIEVVEEYSADQDEVQADRDEMIQVLTNMLRNSLHAVLENKSGKGVVKIATINKDGKLFIDITDNGVGITDENKPKLFESQFSTKNPEVGTGLGLSISRRFVRAFNGDVYLLESQPNKGATFRIELPLTAQVTGVAA